MVRYLPYSETGFFSDIVRDYLSGSEKLKPFFGLPPRPESFPEQIEQKSFSAEQRRLLHGVLQQQYAGVSEAFPEVSLNIEHLLQPDTFTVTTGHQVCLYTGPLYFVYKILTAIRTCEELKKQYPDYNFVPVYWMATEDHDSEEIDHFRFFGKTYRWQTRQKGAVGRFGLEGIEDLLNELPEKLPLFEEAYRSQATLADATRELVNRLFGKFGVVSLDADRREFKEVFKPVLREELLRQASHRLVQQTTSQLATDYKIQVSPRPLNLFYLQDGLRERIEKEGSVYRVLNTGLEFSEEQILDMLEQSPESFSPNVLLRPLYQEMILPNLAYIGGGAEVAYWLELKELFAHFGGAFPILLLRNSALYVPSSISKKLQKLSILPEELFRDMQQLKKKVLAQADAEEISLADQQKQISEVFARIGTLASAIDPTLVKAVAAEEQKALNALQGLEKRLSKAAENKHQSLIEQVQNLHNRLFPGGSLQERTDNVATYLFGNPVFIDQMARAFDPFRPDFTLVVEEG